MILQITSNYFCAGIIFNGTIVCDAAPILKYMKGWSAQTVKRYCDNNRWKYMIIKQVALDMPS